MAVDWVAWHQDYADPDSSLSHRRRVVQDYLRAALAAVAGPERVRLVSLCAGDGGDVLPVLAATEQAVDAVLVESNDALTARAAELVVALGLAGGRPAAPESVPAAVSVSVRTADAGLVGSFADAVPAHIVLACGVFGNISDEDVRRTVAGLPGLLAPAGVVIWTRGRGDGPGDAGQAVRALFDGSGFTELGFTAPATAPFRVGMHRLAPAASRVEPPSGRLFSFR